MPETQAIPAPASVTAVRLPPQNLQAEQSVIGGLLLDNTAFDKVADRIVSDDFYRIEHRLIYEAIVKLSEEGNPPTSLPSLSA